MDNTNRLYTSNNNNMRNKNGNAKKFESVKQLKKLWESESELTNATNGVSKSSRNLNLSDAVKSFNEFKKWSSMQQISPSPPTPTAAQLLPITITTPPSNVVYDSADVEPREETEAAVYEEVRAPPTPPPLPPPPLLIDATTVDNETRSNMSNVLEEIKRFDHTKPKRIEIDKIMTATDMATSAAPQIRGHTSRVDQSRAVVYDSESSSHLVKKLKQKFDNKDQSFIKVCLTITFFNEISYYLAQSSV